MALTCCLRQQEGSRYNADHVHISGPTGHVNIRFRQTIRVADNKNTNFMSPDLGAIPLYMTSSHPKLPKKIAKKGDIFLPLHIETAMFIHFESRGNFAVKVYTGSINAISGRALTSTSNPENSQDYVVLPDQKYLDGQAVEPGLVRQFIAVPTGLGYSIEAQLSGAEELSGIQFEITPQKPLEDELFYVMLVTLTGLRKKYQVEKWMKIFQFKDWIEKTLGIPAGQQMLYLAGQLLEDDRTFDFYKIYKDDIIRLGLRARGGALEHIFPIHELTIAPGGLIRQHIARDFYNCEYWDRQSTLVFRIQVINAARSFRVTGVEPQPPPMDVVRYAQLGLPYYTHTEPEELVASAKNITYLNQKIESLCEIKGISESSYDGPVIKLDTNKPHRVFCPWSELIARAKVMKDLPPIDIAAAMGGRESFHVQVKDEHDTEGPAGASVEEETIGKINADSVQRKVTKQCTVM